MNVAVIKALTRRIEDRYGSNRLAALAAGVQPSVWSDYCNDAKPTSTIPFGRLVTVADAQERATFAELLLGDQSGVPAGDLVCATLDAAEGAVSLQRTVRLADEDHKITPREAREIVDQALVERGKLDLVIKLAERAA